jgi:hypothetical protein
LDSLTHLKSNERRCVDCGTVWKPNNPKASYTTCWKCRQEFGLDYDYADPKSWKRAARKFYGNSCQRCGEEEDLHVHHIIPRSRNGRNTLRNARVLCASCHRGEHERRDLPRDGFYGPQNATAAGTVAFFPHF